MCVVSPSPVERAFTWIVRRARWVGRVPGLPQFADLLARSAVALSDHQRFQAMRKVEVEVSAWPGVTCSGHRFGGVEFRLEGGEFAHLHGCGLLDLRVGREVARECVGLGRAEPHHVFGDSAWLSYWLRNEVDVAGALDLLRLARERTRSG